MKWSRRTLWVLALVAFCAGHGGPAVAGSIKEEAKATAKQTRSEIKKAKGALKTSGTQIKEEATKMGKEIKTGFKAAGKDIKKVFSSDKQEDK